MKKILLSLTFIICLSTLGIGQNSIQLNINHLLGESEFVLGERAFNNMENDFNVNRLEYYLTDISFIHDGGLETKMKNLWILVNAANATEVDLGMYEITNIEKIKFHIGVNPELNHLDPTLYEVTHPLGPKSPSMHWGWSAGYRFIAIEGNGGVELGYEFQLHGLGDDNFFTTEIDLDIVAENNQLTINLDADYTKALEDIDVSWGLIVHGEDLQAKTSIENFRDHVFTVSENANSIDNITSIHSFSVSPNPINDGYAVVQMEDFNQKSTYNLSITSIDGKILHVYREVENGQEINLVDNAAGLYFVNLIKDGTIVNTNKVVVK